MSIRYKMILGSVEKSFLTIDLANEFKIENPEWQNVNIETYDAPEIIEEKIVPQSVPLWCLRTVLRASNLLQPVKDAIELIKDNTLKIAAQEGLEYSNTVLRDSPTTLLIQKVLQLTDAQVDDIFIQANKVEA